MFSKVLVGVDGRQGGRDAIALARQLAADEATMTLAYVFPPFLGRAAAEVSAIERSEGEKMLERERAQASVDAKLVVRGEQSVGSGLHEIAEAQRADLIVVGSTRHAVLGRALMGDDCRAALDGAPCAVAIAPRGYTQTEHELRTLGLGYEGSPESEQALDTACALARRHGAIVKALRVVSLQNVRDERPIPADWPETAGLLVTRSQQQLDRIDGVEGDAVYGGPREELERLSGRVDLLVVGSRGYGPIDRLFHGSVSRYLVRHVACPLLVLPRSAAEPQDAAAERRSQDAVGTVS